MNYTSSGDPLVLCGRISTESAQTHYWYVKILGSYTPTLTLILANKSSPSAILQLSLYPTVPLPLFNPTSIQPYLYSTLPLFNLTSIQPYLYSTLPHPLNTNVIPSLLPCNVTMITSLMIPFHCLLFLIIHQMFENFNNIRIIV